MKKSVYLKTSTISMAHKIPSHYQEMTDQSNTIIAYEGRQTSVSEAKTRNAKLKNSKIANYFKRTKSPNPPSLISIILVGKRGKTC